MSALRTYACLDGSEFPVEFASEAEAAGTWYWDAEHNPAPMTPMDEAVWRGAIRGSSRARSEAGFHPNNVFIGNPGSRYFHGFNYSRPTLPSSEVRKTAKAANERLKSEYGSAGAFWEQWCEPRAIEAFERLRTGAPDLDVDGLIELFGYGFEQTFLMFGLMGEELRRLLADEFGDDGDRLAGAFTPGRETTTLEADQALWDLAHGADALPAVRKALVDGASLAETAAVQQGAEFLENFTDYLAHYGWRTVGWDVSTSTLREQPENVLAIIRRIVAERLAAPASSVASTTANREVLVERISERLSHDPSKLAEFERAVSGASEYLLVKESRALRQLNLTGGLRHGLQVRGRGLLASGLIGAVDDVFYLRPEEVDAGLTTVPGRASDLARLAGARRAERRRWHDAVPPARIGDGAHATEPDEPDSSEIHGIAASPGSYSGIARIMRSLDDFERLAEGEVLVCVTTTPAWTALFAVAGAVIADGGDMVSHTSIAAREYGIPAVVGARGASAIVRDGAPVTVDGTTGVVRLSTNSDGRLERT